MLSPHTPGAPGLPQGSPQGSQETRSQSSSGAGPSTELQNIRELFLCSWGQAVGPALETLDFHGKV